MRIGWSPDFPLQNKCQVFFLLRHSGELGNCPILLFLKKIVELGGCLITLFLNEHENKGTPQLSSLNEHENRVVVRFSFS